MIPPTPDDATRVAAAFGLDAVEARPHGGGHIHDTFVVQNSAGRRVLLQRLNTRVFPDVEGMMDNIARVTGHLHRTLADRHVAEASRRALTLVPTYDGRAFLRDDAGAAWRAYHYLDGTVAHAVLTSPAQAERAAHTFGTFLRDLADLPGPRLVETIPRFHDLRRRLSDFERVLSDDACQRAATVQTEIAFVRTRGSYADVLDEARASGGLPERVVHNDTKVDNLLFDAATDAALCVVDLDTVMPGLALYDFGDLVRTGASTAPEDAPGAMGLDPARFAALARGYVAATRDILTPTERGLLVFAGKLMAFVMGVRFLTDHLAGDVYYKTRHPGHNLDRCRAQFRLIEALEMQEDALAAFIHRL